MASSRFCCGFGRSGRNLGIPKSPFSPNHASSCSLDSRTAAAHFMARCSACRPSMPNTYLGRRQLLFSPVICRTQPQSEPGTGWGTPIVSTTGFPLADRNTRRAAIRRIVRGAAKDLLIRLNGIVSGCVAQSLYSVRQLVNVVPTGFVLVRQAIDALIDLAVDFAAACWIRFVENFIARGPRR